MPLERMWRDYMAEGSSAVQWTELFSIYVHAPPLYEIPPGDFFHNYSIPTAVHGAWGMPSLVAAQKVLYAAALREPRNLRFVLASESCAPLFPRDTLYLQLLSEPLSRINACGATDEAGTARMMPERWSPPLGQEGVPLPKWRKSAQWSSLTRAHAQLTVADQAVYAAFSAACRPKEPHFCLCDEHYIPTLLAMRNLENETSCSWGMTSALWEPKMAHPKILTPPMLTQDGLMRLRGEACQAGEEHRQRRGAGEALKRFLKSWETQAHTLSARALDHEVEKSSLRAVLHSEYESMNVTECYVLARKVQPDAGEAWLAMLMKEA